MTVVGALLRGDVAADGRTGAWRSGEACAQGVDLGVDFACRVACFPHASLPKMPFFVVTHNVTDSKFYKENVEAMIGSLPNCDPINEGDEGLHKKDLHQLSVNFPSSANGDVKIGSRARVR